MYVVNLLPEKYRNNARNQAIKNRLIYGSIFALLLLFLLYRMLISFGNQRYDQYSDLLRDNQNLASIVMKMEDPNPVSADADQISSIIDRITKKSKDYGKLLVLITNSSPDDIKIFQLSMSDEESGVACIIQATASDYDSVSEWISGLSEIDGLGEITSSYIAADEESEESRVEFELRIPIE